MQEASIIGIDPAKNTFQLHGAAPDGAVVFRKKLSRGNVLPFLASYPPAMVAMEACASAPHWGREIAALEQWQLDYARQRAGPQYAAFNEAERDGWFLAESKSFLLSHPGLGARLALAKLEAFVRIMGPLGTLVCFLAAVGGLLRARTPVITVLVIWIVAFVFPYLVAVTYYARYRAPIEPILAVLAGLYVLVALLVYARVVGTERLTG